LSAEFEDLMGTKFKISFILVTCALPTRKIASSRIDMFLKIKQNLSENVPYEAAFNYVAAKL